MSLKRIFDWSVLLLIFSIPLSPFVSVRIQVFVLGLAIVLRIVSGGKSNFFARTWDVGIYILVLVIGLLYTQDLHTGLRVLETNFSFLGIPIILNSYGDFGISRLKRFLYGFTLGLFCACLLCIVNATISYIHSGNINSFFFYELTGIIDSHPAYLAYYLIFAITFCLFLLDLEAVSYPYIILSFIIFFFLMLLLTGGQTTFVSALLVFSFFILRFFLEKRTKSRRLIFILVSIMIPSMLIYSSLNNDKQEQLNDSWDRLALWQSSLEANSNSLLGEGTGDYKIVLNEYYRTHGMHDYAKINFNSHNQFLQILFSNGLLGVLAIFILIARPMYLAFRKNDAFGILVFFPFIVYGMTEVFLGRYQGVVFFSLLHQLFIIYYLSTKSTLSLGGE